MIEQAIDYLYKTKDELESIQEIVKNLRKQVIELQQKNYKDKELAKLKSELDEAKISITEYGMKHEDYEALMSWWNTHKTCHKRISDSFQKNDRLTYHIEISEMPESTVYDCVCNVCGHRRSIFY